MHWDTPQTPHTNALTPHNVCVCAFLKSWCTSYEEKMYSRTALIDNFVRSCNCSGFATNVCYWKKSLFHLWLILYRRWREREGRNISWVGSGGAEREGDRKVQTRNRGSSEAATRVAKELYAATGWEKKKTAGRGAITRVVQATGETKFIVFSLLMGIP